MQIKDVVAVVTGGASGLGEACVRGIVERGGRAAIFDMQVGPGGELAREMGDRAAFMEVDVTDDASVAQGMARAVERFSKINVAINCAGIGGPCKVLGSKGPMPMEFFNKRIQVNLVGTMRVVAQAAEQMANNGPNQEGERGVIITTSSVAATQGQIGQASYAASKGGINGLLLPLAKELAGYGIRVVTIAPGVLETPMFKNVPEAAREALAKSIPFPKRLGRPSEYADLAAHLIENPYLNGEIFYLTGALRLA
ncbi:MAG: SDR family NAD(P)-dependent oxidoreductase [Proteobacteria bacterium]|nr:SDR family NAD(P)-dependent oxidoreductase [Pseudomonadota bacterium]MBU4384731.1 SDR family NAD(P)-dependent oxidoreductase [Pseudomonadota bacterium]MCG2764041.1 SDR family NAD(P)-dependent oxidoreductase [Desulfarculaceae bacterium]